MARGRRYPAYADQVVRIVIPGRQTPWRSADIVQRGPRRIGVTPEQVKVWQNMVTSCAADAMRGLARFDGPLLVLATYFVERPKSRAREVWSDAKPDVGNVTKALLDALQGPVYANDSRISVGIELKPYTTPEQGPWTQVYVASLQNPAVMAATNNAVSWLTKELRRIEQTHVLPVGGRR